MGSAARVFKRARREGFGVKEVFVMPGLFGGGGGEVNGAVTAGVPGLGAVGIMEDIIIGDLDVRDGGAGKIDGKLPEIMIEIPPGQGAVGMVVTEDLVISC